MRELIIKARMNSITIMLNTHTVFFIRTFPTSFGFLKYCNTNKSLIQVSYVGIASSPKASLSFSSAFFSRRLTYERLIPHS